MGNLAFFGSLALHLPIASLPMPVVEVTVVVGFGCSWCALMAAPQVRPHHGLQVFGGRGITTRLLVFFGVKFRICYCRTVRPLGKPAALSIDLVSLSSRLRSWLQFFG